MRMHLNWRQADVYLTNNGHKMSERTWERWMQRTREETRARLREIGIDGYERHHLETIDEIELCRKKMWTEYDDAVKPIERATILEKIINTAPLLSDYYSLTRSVIEKPVVETESNSQKTEHPADPEPESESWALSE